MEAVACQLLGRLTSALAGGSRAVTCRSSINSNCSRHHSISSGRSVGRLDSRHSRSGLAVGRQEAFSSSSSKSRCRHSNWQLGSGRVWGHSTGHAPGAHAEEEVAPLEPAIHRPTAWEHSGGYARVAAEGPMVAAAEVGACQARAAGSGESLELPQIAVLMDPPAQARAGARVRSPCQVVATVRVHTARRPRSKAPAWVTPTAVVLASVAREALREDPAEGTVVFTRGHVLASWRRSVLGRKSMGCEFFKVHNSGMALEFGPLWIFGRGFQIGQRVRPVGALLGRPSQHAYTYIRIHAHTQELLVAGGGIEVLHRRLT